MRRVDRISDTVYNLDNSSVDTNRFYSILLDARSSAVSENMYDITEKLLQSEKENARIALEQLWNLKKNILGNSHNGTIDLLIAHYQEKVDVLKKKEEHIKKVTRDSRSLLEEKRKRDEEIATVKQQIYDCTKEMNELTSKLDKLKTKEQELTLIETQLKKELQVNENDIINGLYEVILAQQETKDQITAMQNTLQPKTVPNFDFNQPIVKQITPDNEIPKIEKVIPENDPIPVQTPIIKTEERPIQQIVEINQQEEIVIEKSANAQADATVLIKDAPVPEYIVYPKSVVKTTQGRIIGEYYYDSQVYKNERHYIFNSKFFCEQLSTNVQLLRQKYNQQLYSELVQMIQDAHKRISENSNLHFEVSTNEILNEKNLKQLWQQAKLRDYDQIDRFCSRMRAKIDALGGNYHEMLQEQMTRSH